MSVDHAASDAETQRNDKETLVNILKDSGPENKYTGEELAQHTTVQATTVRDMIPQLRAEFNLLVFNFGNGYYRIQSDEDYYRAIEAKKEEIENIQTKIDHIVQAYDNALTTGGDPTAEVVAETEGAADDEPELTEEQLRKIENDPVLEPEDFTEGKL
jgi:hypothetical protein